MTKPKKWTEVYPHGTKEGDEESKFFKALARHPKYDWRSTGAIVKASGLPQERVEEIISKYVSGSNPLIYAHPKNEAHWGYWERVPQMLKDDKRDISTKDKDNRVGKLIGADMITFSLDDLGANDDQLPILSDQLFLGDELTIPDILDIFDIEEEVPPPRRDAGFPSDDLNSICQIADASMVA